MAVSAARSSSRVRMRQVALQPMPAGGFEHDGQADLGDEAFRVLPRTNQSMPRAGQAVAPELVFHPRLVPEQIGRLGIRAGHAEGLPQLRQLHLQRLQDAEHAVELAVTSLEQAGRLDQVCGIEPVRYPDQIRKQLRVFAAGGLLDDREQAHIVEPGRRAGEAQGGLEGKRRNERHISHERPCTITA